MFILYISQNKLDQLTSKILYVHLIYLSLPFYLYNYIIPTYAITIVLPSCSLLVSLIFFTLSIWKVVNCATEDQLWIVYSDFPTTSTKQIDLWPS